MLWLRPLRDEDVARFRRCPWQLPGCCSVLTTNLHSGLSTEEKRRACGRRMSRLARTTLYTSPRVVDCQEADIRCR
eukprot:scaffold69920_cov73-Phaeocystis_antarctica.AAC.2